MAFKVGQRVEVLPLAKDDPRAPHAGKKGEIVQIDEQGRLLVDDQIVHGEPVGVVTMREWYLPHEIDHG